MSTPLPTWLTRDSFRREPHQRIIDRVNETSNLFPPSGGEVLRTPFGTTVLAQQTQLAPTDCTVYIDNLVSGSGKAGIYTGYYFRKQPFTPTSGTPCEIHVDDEVYSLLPSTSSGQHWSLSQSYGVGRFNGEYNTDTPPKPIIRATGFACQMSGINSPTLHNTNQRWSRQQPYADTSNPANLETGDEPPTISICTRQDAVTKVCFFRQFSFDASGRLWLIEHE